MVRLNTKISKVDLLGVNISQVTLQDVFDVVNESCESRKKIVIGNVNIHAMNLAYRDSFFRECLNSFEIVFCDGFGVKVATGLTGKKLPERFTPPDFINRLLQIICDNKGSVYLLGAEPGIARKASIRLQKNIPELNIAGYHHGYFDHSKSSIENQKVCVQINDASPTLLLVGFGMPLQEKWIYENWNDLNSVIVLPVGALFDTLSGEIIRGPHFLTNCGFEWLTRLWFEPKRLWKRYIIGNPLFFFRILARKFSRLENSSLDMSMKGEDGEL